jgi:DUF971 family protein
MTLEHMEVIGTDLALKWSDGSESFIALTKLRQHCPCAACKGEVDVMGNLYKAPEQTLSPRAFELTRLNLVGGYAVQPLWADGHSTGLYTFDYLKRLSATV